MVALEELADCLAGSTDGVCFPVREIKLDIFLQWYFEFEVHLPSGVNAGRLGLVQSRRAVVLVETNNQRTNAERADTTALCIPLLHASNILGDVFDGDGVLDSETVRLGL